MASSAVQRRRLEVGHDALTRSQDVSKVWHPGSGHVRVYHGASGAIRHRVGQTAPALHPMPGHHPRRSRTVTGAGLTQAPTAAVLTLMLFASAGWLRDAVLVDLCAAYRCMLARMASMTGSGLAALGGAFGCQAWRPSS